MIKEIIFDCFGVLTQDGWLAFLQKFANDENIDELRYINHQADKGLIKYPELLAKVVELSGASKDEAHRIITTDIHINEEVVNFIQALKTKYKIGMISNVGRPIDVYLPKRVVELFDTVTLSFETGMIKPAQGIFDTHLQKSGYKAAETVFIDDREYNADGAKKAGMHAIWYRSLEQLKTELQQLGVQT